MRKVIIAGAVIAAGAVGYMVNQQGESDSSEYSPLAYVPADSVIFSGQLESFPLKDYLNSTMFPQAKIPDDLLEELDDGTDPKERFFASLVKSYFEAAHSVESFQKTFGLPDQIKTFVYAVGFMPVVRYQVTDEQGLWAVLDKAEQESGFKHEARTLNKLAYRAYSFENNAEGEKFEVLVAYENGWATWTINTHVNTESDVELALAQTKPAASLQDAGILEDIQTKHGFINATLSYLDHKGLVTAFTTADGNRLASMLTKAMEMEGKGTDLDRVRTAECQAEMGAMAANWPRTVAGIRSHDDLKITSERSYMKAALVVESNNKVVLDALTSMQGFIPSYLSEAQVFGMGLGLDANKLGPALSSIWSNMLEPSYKCEPLLEMQADIQQANPAALGMFTGMAQGVKGVAVGVQDFSISMDSSSPKLNSLDGIVSLSAEDPAVLFNMAKAFVPQLAQLQLPTDGSPVDLSTIMPLPTEVDIKPMLALKGKHLVVYNGEKGKAIADQLAGETVESNGLLSFSVDYKKMFEPILPILEMAGDPEVTEQLDVLKNMDMRVKMDINLNEQGILIESEADIKAP
ncbi:hypothetical protein [Neptuniibacter sp. 2_MG-2023]|uniref:hypothetical protein n=1 Tax=Neptuniibacter sp. 2_MG-2023 TaxID=3062671 RepID=UPI0026E3F8DC|nr:hypothetical protein [Neptuniibacter sp. 2_MG-2023]MDO6514228.1 hypothetical protein [Neptuniibacter sp. 2_MG-2023]